MRTTHRMLGLVCPESQECAVITREVLEDEEIRSQGGVIAASCDLRDALLLRGDDCRRSCGFTAVSPA